MGRRDPQGLDVSAAGMSENEATGRRTSTCVQAVVLPVGFPKYGQMRRLSENRTSPHDSETWTTGESSCAAERTFLQSKRPNCGGMSEKSAGRTPCRPHHLRFGQAHRRSVTTLPTTGHRTTCRWAGVRGNGCANQSCRTPRRSRDPCRAGMAGFLVQPGRIRKIRQRGNLSAESDVQSCRATGRPCRRCCDHIRRPEQSRERRWIEAGNGDHACRKY